MNGDSSQSQNDNKNLEISSEGTRGTTNISSAKDQKPSVSFNIPIPVWLAIIAAVPVIYGSYLSYLQGKMQIEFPLLATQTVAALQTANPIIANLNTQTAVTSTTDSTLTTNTDNVIVSFTNPSIWATVHVALIQNGIPFDNFDISPGAAETRKLPPGRYQIDARAVYPKITPSSANCYIHWQENTSYTGNLFIDLNTASVQVKQFYLEPREICLTQSPMPILSTETN